MPSSGAPARCRSAASRAGVFAAIACAAALFAAFNRPLFLAVNGVNSPAADWLMMSVTELGNGLVAALIVLIVSPFRGEVALRGSFAMAAAGLATTIVKEL